MRIVTPKDIGFAFSQTRASFAAIMRSILVYPALGLLRLYQIAISPALQAVGVRCRHTPSCSHFMMEAMRRHGFWAGGWMGLARWLRCNPWGTCGPDPVPMEAPGPWYMPWRYGRWK
jgi:putative membrane protein insertion efficiency factor